MTRPESSLIRARRLASRIRNEPRYMPSPCSRCRNNGRRCLVHPTSGCCSECINHSIKCNLVVTQPEWNWLDRDKKKLQDQLRQAQEETVAARSQELRLHQQLA
ncbi:hypothetical protein K469DRAFT_767244 [Zopfia rhizophila CBS 207.26]|uniref:Zn(2)-C6 fungal-type domain-containing protein n=1 Tax=Zopfia rhizophila CBS 207.26 TaxID=1314779 RepID=A0A6A6E9F6_9PEZI|nr:hypothetical protein K469DRAFT_767244 [Zopfia rhizophila CBS 207.26]